MTHRVGEGEGGGGQVDGLTSGGGCLLEAREHLVLGVAQELLHAHRPADSTRRAHASVRRGARWQWRVRGLCEPWPRTSRSSRSPTARAERRRFDRTTGVPRARAHCTRP
jgi:hypothetical protein